MGAIGIEDEPFCPAPNFQLRGRLFLRENPGENWSF
jgi:hypothetical protein